MKKLLLLITFMALSGAAFCQTDSISVWNKWCSRKDTLLLFNSANNVILVYSPTLKPSEIKLKSLDMGLRIGKPEIKGDTLSVMAMPYKTRSKSKNMRLAILNSKTNRPYKTVNFVNDSVPKLMATMGNIHTPEASKKELLSQLVLKLEFPGSLYSYPYTLKSYTFRIQSSKGAALMNVNGFFLAKEIFQEIKDAPPGAVVEFLNIKATCPDCVMKTLDDIKIKVR